MRKNLITDYIEPHANKANAFHRSGTEIADFRVLLEKR